MKKNGYEIIISLAVIAFIISMFLPIQAQAQFYPFPPPYPPMPVFTPYYVPPAPALIPPAPIRSARATTLTVALPSPVVAPALLPVVPAPIISTTQLFLGLLLSIGEESGLFATNPALFWYIVGILY